MSVEQRVDEVRQERERILCVFDRMARSVAWEDQVSRLFAIAFRREVQRQ